MLPAIGAAVLVFGGAGLYFGVLRKGADKAPEVVVPGVAALGGGDRKSVV